LAQRLALAAEIVHFRRHAGGEQKLGRCGRGAGAPQRFDLSLLCAMARREGGRLIES
jgi:hypothetical protein